MGCWRAYMKPFDDNGNYADWIDVSDDGVFDDLGSVNIDLDNTEFDIGVYRNSNFSISMKNQEGLYSDVGSARTIFKYRRSGTLFKLTWQLNQSGPITGIAQAGIAVLGEEIEVFTGLLDDQGTSMDLDSQKVTFAILGRESVFQRTIVPFEELSDLDPVSAILFASLNQLRISNILQVSAENISVGTDVAIDSVASFENKTVQEVLNGLLLISNSVLFIRDGAIFVQPRTPSAEVVYTFYGQGAAEGAESARSIKRIRNGLSKVLNYLVWRDGPFIQDDTSIARNDFRKREFEYEFITTPATQEEAMEGILNEFRNPKLEFDLLSPLNYDTIALGLLDRVVVNYPVVPIAGQGVVPLWDVAVEGSAVAPDVLWTFEVFPEDHFKIMGRSIDIKNGEIRFRLRAV